LQLPKPPSLPKSLLYAIVGNVADKCPIEFKDPTR
jgi:hypothetical protein